MPQDPEKNKFSVTILGSGTCVPSLTRSACAVLIRTAGACIVLDAGPGTMGRLLAAGVLVQTVTHLFISHFHPDHTGELAAFLFANKYPDPGRRKTALTLGSGPGFLEFYKKWKDIYGAWIDVDGRLNLLEFDREPGKRHDFGAFTLSTAPAAHNPESLAYRVTGPDGTAVVYSGDTDYAEPIINLAENADLFICECALPDDLKVPGHLTPSLAGKMARAAGVKKLVLTHFYPECDNVDITAQCRTTYGGPLVLARDLLTISPD